MCWCLSIEVLNTENTEGTAFSLSVDVFAGLRFAAHVVGKLSHVAISCPRCGEAFVGLQFAAHVVGKLSQACNSLPTLWGSFRRPAIRCPRCGEAFAGLQFVAHGVGRLSQACNSLPTPWGSFRRPAVSLIEHRDTEAQRINKRGQSSQSLSFSL